MIVTPLASATVSRACVLLSLFAGVLASTGARAAESDAPRRPNIVVIVSDDHGYGDIGVHGCRDIPTPNIDSLAKNGVRCSNGYVSGPYCSPTRAGLMTGRYQQRFGHEFNPGPAAEANQEHGLSLDETTLPQRLKEAGYKTGMVGKWHLGYAERFHPMKRGFDEFFGFLGGAHPYFNAPRSNDPILRGTKPIEKYDYLTDSFGSEAVAFIERHQKEPFFLYLPFNAVHGPMNGAERYMNRFEQIADEKRRTYATMLTAMDDAIGAVLAKIREAGIEDDTLIFFFSDNGGPEPVNASDNGPLRGVKATTWEGGIRVPFLVQWKGTLPAGKVFDHPVIQLDIQPTALAAAGIEIKSDWKLDGVNLLPHFTGRRDSPPHDALFWRFGAQWAIRSGDWKLVATRDSGGERQPLRRGKPDLAGGLLFNLRDDVGEQHDLAEKQPERVKELQAAWLKWNGELKEPAWGGPAQAAAKKKKKTGTDR